MRTPLSPMPLCCRAAAADASIMRLLRRFTPFFRRRHCCRRRHAAAAAATFAAGRRRCRCRQVLMIFLRRFLLLRRFRFCFSLPLLAARYAACRLLHTLAFSPPPLSPMFRRCRRRTPLHAQRSPLFTPLFATLSCRRFRFMPFLRRHALRHYAMSDATIADCFSFAIFIIACYAAAALRR